MNNNNLFSKEALAKLRSPDKLDSLFSVVSPVHWAMLLTVGVLLFSVFLWSIFGSLVEKVEGTGLLLSSNETTKVFAMSNGKIDKIMIKPGSLVKKGQIIAKVFRPDAEIEYQLAKDNTYFATDETNYRQLNNNFDSQRFSRIYNDTIISPCDGVIDQLGIAPEMVISAGSSICTIRSPKDNEDLGGVFYVAAPTGHKIIPGMLLQLSPGGYNEERDGQLLTVVTQVSQYPVDQETVQKSVKSSALVTAIMNATNNACLEVKFRLIKDTKATSGYLWTTEKGPEKPLQGGTMVTGYAVVERVPPIEKVFYKIKSLLRSR